MILNLSGVVTSDLAFVLSRPNVSLKGDLVDTANGHTRKCKPVLFTAYSLTCSLRLNKHSQSTKQNNTVLKS